MAATKISGLTADTAPVRSTDYVPTYDASAVATKKVLLNNLGVIPITAAFFNLSPADATTYYWGLYPGQSATTSAGFSRMYIQRAGVITQAHILITGPGAGTAETSTMSIRLNNTTDSTISAAVTTNATTQTFANTSMTLAVAVNDYIEIKWVTPTWVTNPTGLACRVSIILE